MVIAVYGMSSLQERQENTFIAILALREGKRKRKTTEMKLKIIMMPFSEKREPKK
jgi:hypothetical protein